MFRYERWLIPEDPTRGLPAETRRALSLLPTYAPPPLPVHRITWERRRRVPLGQQVAWAWERTLKNLPDPFFTDLYLDGKGRL